MGCDPHSDAYSNLAHWLGAKKSAANWAAYLVHQGNVDATKSVQIGMRGNPRGKDWLKMSLDLWYEVITIAETHSRRTNAAVVTQRASGQPS